MVDEEFESIEKKDTAFISPCKLGTKIYLIRSYCCLCPYDQGDYCSCEKQHKNKIIVDTVTEITFFKEGWYLRTEDCWKARHDAYKKSWFFTLEEAKAKMEDIAKG